MVRVVRVEVSELSSGECLYVKSVHKTIEVTVAIKKVEC